MSVRDTSQIAVQRANRMIEPNGVLLRVLATDEVAAAADLGERLDRSAVLADRLIDNPLVSAMLVGYDNGDYLLIRPLDRRDVRLRVRAPAGAAYLVQTVTQQPDGSRRGEAFFRDARHELVLYRPEPDYNIDPRQRPWYTGAIDTVSTVTSGPYVLFTTGEIGLTLSRLAYTGQAVVALDITLEDLGAGLGGLQMTPNAELALVDAHDTVVGYHDMEALLVEDPATKSLGVRLLSELKVDSLTHLHDIGQLNQPVSYQASGEDWFGVALPFDGIEGLDLRLLAAAPTRELLGDLEHYRQRMILISTVLILVFFPLGWKVGSAVGEALERLADQARPMSYFDFRRRKMLGSSQLSEVDSLSWVMDNVADAVEAFLSISQVLGAEPRIESMLKQVLEHLVRATRCDGGAIYLWGKDTGSLMRVVLTGEPGDLPEQRPALVEGAAQGGRFKKDDGRWQSEFELRSRRGDPQGLLVIVYKSDGDHSTTEFQEFTKRLTGMLAIAIETRQLIDAQKQLFEATIRILADAIDAKSPYTGGHCERVPQLATMLADRMIAEDSGPYAEFRLDDDERYAFHLAAWLHDCGKVTSSEHIVDKATKLETIYNRIHEIRMRFEVLWRDAQIDYLTARLAGEDEQAVSAWRDARRAQLQDDFAFIAACNIGGEFMADEAIVRLRRIGEQTWLRHFDDGLGLSAQESQRLRQARPVQPKLPVPERLLADRPEQIVPWDDRKPPVEKGDPRNVLGFDMVLPAHKQNMGELHNLSVRRGTLTDEDRFAVNDHIVQTLIMLKSMPWPDTLARVPDIAANHHEKMDGTGYPRRLPGEDLQITDRIMALADVFEALTAGDRPYKPAKTLSESLRIMAFMSRDKHLDAELFVYFLHSKVWMQYARGFMHSEQIDEVDIEALARIAKPEAIT